MWNSLILFLLSPCLSKHRLPIQCWRYTESVPQRSLVYPVNTQQVYIYFFFNCIFVLKSAVLFEYIIWNEEAFLLIQKTIQAIIKSLFKFKFRTSLFLNCLPAFGYLHSKQTTHTAIWNWKVWNPSLSSQKCINDGRVKNVQGRARHQLRSLNTAGCQSPSSKGVHGFGATGTHVQAWAELPRDLWHFRCHHVLHEVQMASCSAQHMSPTPHFTRSPPSEHWTQQEASSHTFCTGVLSHSCFLLIYKARIKFKYTWFLC